MKKIGIISLYYHSENCGGVLQALALERVLRDKGFDAEQILYRRSRNTSRRLKLKKNGLGWFLRRMWERVQTELCDRLFCRKELRMRRRAFSGFKEKFIRDSRSVYTEDTIRNTLSCYDAFVCGSDQVWLPGSVDQVRLLGFVPEETLKFSYSASIAAEIPREKEALYREAIETLRGVSVRESGARDALRRITHREIQLTLDPTLLLSAQAWQEYAAGRLVPGRYILCYLLGNDRRVHRAVREFARKKGLPIVCVICAGKEHELSALGFGDKRMIAVGPAEFLALIRDAAYVFADSFHAVAFSVIFRKEFWAFHRKTYTAADDRIRSLLGLLHIEGRCLEEPEALREESDGTIAYEAVNERLREWTGLSHRYLDACLKEAG